MDICYALHSSIYTPSSHPLHFDFTPSTQRVHRHNPLINLGFDSAYAVKGEANDDRWYSEVNFEYTIDKLKYESRYVGFDGIFIDMNVRKSKDGGHSDRYGGTWINAYITTSVMASFMKSSKDVTGWSASSKSYIKDDALIRLVYSVITRCK